MLTQFREGGLGRPLRATLDLTGNVADGQRLTIEDGECTEIVAAHDGQELLFYMEFDTVPDDAEPEASLESSEEESSLEESSEEVADGSIYIERVTQDFLAADVHATVAIDSLSSYSWRADGPLLGYYRVRNAVGVPIRVWTNITLV